MNSQAVGENNRSGRATKAKTVTFYRSGDVNFAGLRMAITQKNYRTFETLLDELTKKVSLPQGARRVHTPGGVHSVTSVEDLEDGKSYVVTSSKKLKPLNLDSVQKQRVWVPTKKSVPNGTVPKNNQNGQKKPLKTKTTPKEKTPPVRDTLSGKLPPTPKKIMIMKNGDIQTKHMMLLNRRTAQNFEDILQDISEIFKLPVKKLCTPDGSKIESLQAIFNGPEVFVALSGTERFRPLNYLENSPFKASRSRERLRRKSEDNTDQPPTKITKKSKGKWRVWIATNENPAAGTDATVYMVVYGDKGKTDDIILGAGDGYFEAGNEDEFTIQIGDVGEIYKIRIGHDDSTEYAGWRCDEGSGPWVEKLGSGEDSSREIWPSGRKLKHLKTSTKQKVILLLSDGLRWDRFGVDVPNLDEIEKNGVRADWLDGVFPTMTMPSTFSIATGLYPESHGVVMNEYFDKVTKERTYKFVDTLNVTKWFDTGVEPIWVTAKNAGKSVGSILYIASWLPIKGVQPDRVVPLSPYFWDNYSLKERVRDAVNWISDDLDLVLVYFNNPDLVLHSYPIEDKHSIQSVKDVDTQIGYLFQLIEERGLSDEVNVIIVSDHGFIDMKPRKFIRLYDYTDESDVEFLVDYGPAIFQLAPVAGKLEKVYQALKVAHPAMHVYKKEEFPDRLHYAKHPRNLPIIGFVDPEWHYHKTWDPSTDKISGGNHGYDNRWMSMKSSFYAQGPFFKKGYRARPLESVDIYGMVCEILDIPPAPNNGSRDRYVNMITSSGAPLSPIRLIFILLVLVVIACRE